jgi:hypothetical protein
MFFALFFSFCAFLLFLFSLYVLGKEDLQLLRKNIGVDDIFTTAILSGGVGLFFARLFFSVENFEFFIANPLAFFLLIRYPGLSFAGGLLAGCIFFLFLAKKRKMPLAHMADFFGFSLMLSMPFLSLAGAMLREFSFFTHIFLPLLYALLAIVERVMLYSRKIRNEIEAGVLGAVSLLFLSFIILIVGITENINQNHFFLLPKDSVSLLLFLGSLIFLVKREYVFNTLKR